MKRESKKSNRPDYYGNSILNNMINTYPNYLGYLNHESKKVLFKAIKKNKKNSNSSY